MTRGDEQGGRMAGLKHLVFKALLAEEATRRKSRLHF